MFWNRFFLKKKKKVEKSYQWTIKMDHSNSKVYLQEAYNFKLWEIGLLFSPRQREKNQYTRGMQTGTKACEWVYLLVDELWPSCFTVFQILCYAALFWIHLDIWVMGVARVPTGWLASARLHLLLFVHLWAFLSDYPTKIMCHPGCLCVSFGKWNSNFSLVRY